MTIADPNDSRHGRHAGAQAHIRARVPMCQPCRVALNKYRREILRDLRAGRRRTIPVTDVRAHIRDLSQRGMLVKAIAERAGVGRSTVQDLLTNPRPTVRTDTAEALYGVELRSAPLARVDRTGVMRRVRALACNGWSYPAIVQVATAKGHRLTVPALREAMRPGTDSKVTVQTRDAVAAAFDTLALRFAPPGRSSSFVSLRAARFGWLPPLAWDDIDDPDEIPSATREDNHHHRDDVDHAVVVRMLGGERLHSSPAEKAEVCRIWVRAGGTLRDLEDRMGWKAERYYRISDDDAVAS